MLTLVLLCAVGADVSITANDISEAKDRAYEECTFKRPEVQKLTVVVVRQKGEFLDSRKMVPVLRSIIDALREMGVIAPDLQSSLVKAEDVLGLKSQGLRLTERALRVCWAWEVLKLQGVLGVKTEVVFK